MVEEVRLVACVRIARAGRGTDLAEPGVISGGAPFALIAQLIGLGARTLVHIWPVASERDLRITKLIVVFRPDRKIGKAEAVKRLDTVLFGRIVENSAVAGKCRGNHHRVVTGNETAR